MIALLEAERDALIANDSERVAELAAQKADLAQDLAGASVKAEPDLAPLATKARELNKLNEALLQQRITQTRQALALLRGTPDGKGGHVYGRDGRTAPSAIRRGFTAA
jgi:flagellar biosynthesis/type III secretory pathway chaperone